MPTELGELGPMLNVRVTDHLTDVDIGWLENLLRRLATTPLLRFAGAYVAMSGVAMAFVAFGAATDHRVLTYLGSSLALGATSIFVSVAVWYRRQNVINTSITIAVAWNSARIVSLMIAALLLRTQDRSLGTLGLIGTLFGLPIALLEWILAAALLVAVLRRFRAPVSWSSKAEE